MRERTAFVCICILLLSVSCAAAGPAAADNPPARVTFFVGEVTVASEAAAPTPATLSMAVRAGDTVATGPDSRCELTLCDGSVLRMEENGSHTLAAADFSKKKNKVEVLSRAGRVWAKVSKSMGKNREFSVGTDKAVCAVRGTAFDVAAGEDATDIAVFEGTVSASAAISLARTSDPRKVEAPTSVPGPHPVSMQKWVELVSAMQRLVVRADGTHIRSDIAESLLTEDPWVKWNRERDAALAASSRP